MDFARVPIANVKMTERNYLVYVLFAMFFFSRGCNYPALGRSPADELSQKMGCWSRCPDG
jgi:hypothetical protein